MITHAVQKHIVNYITDVNSTIICLFYGTQYYTNQLGMPAYISVCLIEFADHMTITYNYSYVHLK